MSLSGHISELERKHQALEQKIAAETVHPNPDAVRLAEMKRQKLTLKDELNRLRAQTGGTAKA